MWTHPHVPRGTDRAREGRHICCADRPTGSLWTTWDDGLWPVCRSEQRLGRVEAIAVGLCYPRTWRRVNSSGELGLGL